MKNIDKIIESVKPNDKKSLSEAVNHILMENDVEFGKNRVSVGQTVVMPDEDQAYPGGQAGKVKSIDEDHGYADIELPNGTVIKAMLSSLYPVIGK